VFGFKFSVEVRFANPYPRVDSLKRKSHLNITMATEHRDEPAETVETMTRYQIYHALNRAKRLEKAAERYHNDPAVIAKRAERERLKAEKEAAKTAAKAVQDEQKKQQKQLAKELKQLKQQQATEQVRAMVEKKKLEKQGGVRLVSESSEN